MDGGSGRPRFRSGFEGAPIHKNTTIICIRGERRSTAVGRRRSESFLGVAWRSRNILRDKNILDKVKDGRNDRMGAMKRCL